MQEGLFFTRSGSTHTPRHSTLQWLGDQLVTWDEYDGMASTIGAVLSSGLSGFAFSHSDIGGYTSISKYLVVRFLRSPQLLRRRGSMQRILDTSHVHYLYPRILHSLASRSVHGAYYLLLTAYRYLLSARSLLRTM